MIKLTKSLMAWGLTEFERTLKSEIQQLDPGLLPLQKALSLSSYVSDRDFSVVILKISEAPDIIKIKAGIFYTGIISGCSCSDDPSPQDEQTEYCEVQLEMDRGNAETCVKLLSD